MSRDRVGSGVTAERFDRLMAALDPDRGRAAQAYESLRQRLLTFFRLSGFPEAHDLFDKTMDIAARRLSEIQIDNLGAFITVIAQNVRFEAMRDRKRMVSLTGQSERAEELFPDRQEAERQEQAFDCLNRCLERLDVGQRSLVLEYYKYAKAEKIASHQKMAATFGTTPGTLRVRAYRVKQKLEDCVRHCMSVDK